MCVEDPFLQIQSLLLKTRQFTKRRGLDTNSKQAKLTQLLICDLNQCCGLN